MVYVSSFLLVEANEIVSETFRNKLAAESGWVHTVACKLIELCAKYITICMHGEKTESNSSVSGRYFGEQCWGWTFEKNKIELSYF